MYLHWWVYEGYCGHGTVLAYQTSSSNFAMTFGFQKSCVTSSINGASLEAQCKINSEEHCTYSARLTLLLILAHSSVGKTPLPQWRPPNSDPAGRT
jgi:hypothetical protein